MPAARVSWAECLVIGFLVFGLAGTSGVLLLLVGLVRLIRTDQSSWDVIDPTIVAFAATAAALTGVLAWRRIMATRDARPLWGPWPDSSSGSSRTRGAGFCSTAS